MKSLTSKILRRLLGRHQGDLGKNMGGRGLLRRKRQLQVIDDPVHGLKIGNKKMTFIAAPCLGQDIGSTWPTLVELHVHLFGRSYDRPHDAAGDLEACARCFFKLLGDGYYRLPPSKR